MEVDSGGPSGPEVMLQPRCGEGRHYSANPECCGKTESYCLAGLTHQLTGVNSGCPVILPSTAYGGEKEVSLESVYSQP